MNFSKNSSKLIRSGGIISTIGVSMLILLGITLLLFPVAKICTKECIYQSSAPDFLKQFINPIFLFSSLIFISIGVFLIRFGNWKFYKRKEDDA